METLLSTHNNCLVFTHGADSIPFRIVGDFSSQKRYAKFNTKVQVIDKNPIEFTSEIQPTSAKISLKRQDFIDGNAEIKLGKELKFDVSGSGKQLFNGRVALDATNFLQTNYVFNDDNVNAFLVRKNKQIFLFSN